LKGACAQNLDDARDTGSRRAGICESYSAAQRRTTARAVKTEYRRCFLRTGGILAINPR
jgi:hypothetical protein